MKSEIYIRYEGAIKDDDSQVLLSDLGKSLIAFERLVKDLGHSFRFSSEIDIYVTSHREGSQIFDILIKLSESLDSIPIESVEHLLEFLKFTSHDLWQSATVYFDDLKEFHRTTNEYFAKYPVDLVLLASAIPVIFKLARKQRGKQLPVDPRISERLANEILKLLRKNKFGNFIYPIVNESAKSIEVSTDRTFQKNTAKVDSSNFEDYMGEATEVLPHLIDGEKCKLRGVVTSLKSTRGDSLTFHFREKGKTYNLDLFPQAGRNTKNYIQFYKESVEILATVERTSLYKKPKLHMDDMALLQEPLDLDGLILSDSMDDDIDTL